jgi:serine/threonine-protein kinase
LILHELLSGSPAFQGTTLPGICASIAADPPAALRLKRPEVPPEVEAIVLKCLEKEPERRFQTARELVESLSRWTGRAESVAPRDATVRSSLPFGVELSELGSGSTVSLTPSKDTGTLASAVFTRSGPRLIAPQRADHPKHDVTWADPPRPLDSAPEATDRKLGQRRKVALGSVSALLLALSIWAVHGLEAREPAAVPPTTPSIPLPISAAVPAKASPMFVLQIDSRPAGAEVFEGSSVLGTTPMQVSVDAARVSGAPRTFTVRKSGYLPYTIVQGAGTKDARVLAELTAEPAIAAAKPTKKPPTAKNPVETKAAEPPNKAGSDIFMQR